jgi:4-hydroxy-tetrahydrodipicolinate synthase
MSYPDGLQGTWFVVPTPFRADGSVDLDALRRLTLAAVFWGVDGLTLMGVTSEAPRLSGHERLDALQAIADTVGGRIPFVVGCSGESVEVVAERIQEAKRLGALAAMVAAPSLLHNLDSLAEFYGAVAARGELPLVVQDEPAATGVTIPVSVLLRCLEASGCRVVKLEDPPTPPKIARLLDADGSLHVFGGLGGAFALSEIRRGARGTMTGFAFPEVLRAVWIRASGGHHEDAARIFDRYLPLIQFEAQQGVGLAIRKELLRRRGVISTHTTRGPVRGLDQTTLDELDDMLRRVGIEPGPERLEIP